jgi:predicted DNA-binding transcriptional regulator YafY
MDTAGRLLRLLGLLQTYRDWTAENLANRLEVTERTVRRDMVRLRNLGYPVEAMAGPGGGYRLGAGGKLPPLLLDDDEALAVAVSLRTAAGGIVGGLEEAALSALSKLEPVLPPKVRGRLEDVTATTLRLGTAEPASVDPVTLALVAGAARAQERVRFHYVAADGRESERLCEPFRLVFTQRRWYLVAYDCDRADWRTFRLDRIGAAYATRVRFRRVDPPDAEQLVAHGISVAPYVHQAQVELFAPIEDAAVYVPPTVGRLEASGKERSLLTLGGDDLGWIARYVGSLPFRFRVVSPPELTGIIADLARRMLADVAGTEPRERPR